MKNKGQITVFLSLVLISLLGLFFAATDIVGIYMNRARVAEAARGASLHIQADYQPQIFEQYHLLLLDKTCMGNGEGMLEEKMIDYMDYTLSGYGFSVNDVCLTDSRSVLADDCFDLKKQINEYMTLYLEAKAIEEVKEKLEYDASDAEDVTADIQSGKNEEAEQEGSWKGTDPRTLLKQELGNGLLQLVLPAGKTVSGNVVSMENVPSGYQAGKTEERDVDVSFTNIDHLEAELGMVTGLENTTVNSDINGILYAMDCFGTFMDPYREGHEFQCEVEYLIAGKNSDHDNLSYVVNQMILHRLPVNMAVLLSDQKKMAEIGSMAATLALVPGITYGAAKFLLTACFSYGESVLEIRSLLAGNKIPIRKTIKDWKLELENIGRLHELTSEDYQGKNGIDYKTFLMLLLAEKSGSMYVRMCDLIQLNVALKEDSFRIKNCVDALTFDIDISKGKRSYQTSVSAVY